MFAPFGRVKNKTALIPIGTNAVRNSVRGATQFRLETSLTHFQHDHLVMLLLCNGSSRLSLLSLISLGGSKVHSVLSFRAVFHHLLTALCAVVQHVLFLVKTFRLIIWNRKFLSMVRKDFVGVCVLLWVDIAGDFNVRTFDAMYTVYCCYCKNLQ